MLLLQCFNKTFFFTLYIEELELQTAVVPPHLSYFLEVELRKCMEPVGNLANVEELDLKTGQRRLLCRN